MHGIYTNMIYREIVYETINELQQLTSTKKKHKNTKKSKSIKRKSRRRRSGTQQTLSISQHGIN